ncbi:MAG: PAS domain S-box protein [Vicinamibacteria bacterium]|nr:PAS domain S-box protein [Vicinamibacteria bacterium]
MAQEPRRRAFTEETTSALMEENEALRLRVATLRESEDRYRRLAEAVSDYIYSVRVEDGRAVGTRHSPGCEAVTGYSSQELAADPLLWYRMVVEEDRALVADQARCLMRGESCAAFEHRVLRKDGAVRWIQNTPVCHRDADGRLLGYDGLIRDVTARKEAERALRKSEDRFRALFEGIDDAVVVHLYGTKEHPAPIIEANDAACRLVGRDRAELIGMSALDFAARDSGVDQPAIRLRLEASTTAAYDAVLIHRDGRRIPAGIRSRSFVFEGQEAIISVVRDITARKRDDELLRAELDLLMAANEKRELSELLDLCLASAIRMSGMDSGGVYVRRGSEGVTLHCHRGLSDAFVAAVRNDALDSANYRILQEGRPVYRRYADLDVVKGDSQIKEGLRAIAVLPLLHRGQIVGCMNIASHASDDIAATARVALETIAALAGGIIARAATERALERSEERLNRIVETSPIGIVIIDRGGTITFANSAAERILGVSRSEILGRRSYEASWKVTAPDGTPLLEEELPFARVMRGGASVAGADIVVVHPGGRRRVLSINAAPLKDEHESITAVVASIDDVTERKDAERALRDSEARLASVLRAAPVGIGLVRDRVLLQVNEWICELVGRSAGELIGRSARVLYSTQEDYDYVGREKYRQIAEYGTRSVETKWIGKDGSLIDILLSSTPLDPRDPSRGVTFTAVDITARKQAERALRRERDLMRTYLEIAAVMFVVLDAECRVSLINRKGCEILGYDAREIVGKHWIERFVPERLHDKARATFLQLMRGDIEPAAHYENPVLTWSGEERVISWHNTVLHDADGKIVATLSSGEDVTERRRAEDERSRFEIKLRQQQKLESIGTLAAGVAHEINNPVNGIMNYAQLISNRLPAENRLRAYADRIVEEGERVSEIVRNLLAFSRQERQAHGPARIQDIVASAVGLVRAVLRKEHIALDVDVPEELPQVRCRSRQIQQVMLNLLTNARDAINEHCRENETRRHVGIQARLLEKDGRSWIRITVADCGGGVPREVGERVFDPFFTTKPRDKGTGLGLSISYGIARDHQGALWFESESGSGARFHLDLPLDAEAAIERAVS